MSLAAPRRRAPAQWPGTKMAAPSGALWTALLLVTAALALAGAVSEPTTVPFDVRPGGVVHSFSQDVGPGVSAEPPSGASPTVHCRDWTKPVPVRPGVRRNGRGGVTRRPATQRGVAAAAAACQALPTYTHPPLVQHILKNGILGGESRGSQETSLRYAGPERVARELGPERNYPRPYTGPATPISL